MRISNDSPFAFEAVGVPKNGVSIGSIPKLGSEILDLNDKTWKSDSETTTQWLKDCFGDDPDLVSLEKSAQYGFAVLLGFANKAIENKLIIKLDFKKIR